MSHRSPLLIILAAALGLAAGCATAGQPDPNLPTVQTLAGLTELPALAALEGPGGTATLAVVLADTLEIAQIDMATGAVTLQYTSPSNPRLNGLTAGSPEFPTVLAYAPPPSSGLQTGLSGLYTLSEAGELAVWIGLSTAEIESYLHPVWSPDGQGIVYAHYRALGPDASQPYIFQIERRAYPQGEPEVLIENGIRPALSPDGQWLAYLNSSPSSEDTSLLIANADGSDPRPLLDPDFYPTANTPVFSPDSQWVYFSLPHKEESDNQSQESSFWGVRTARAHGAAANWWRVPARGGEPEQLTELETSQLQGALSPDGDWLLSASDQGLFLVDLASGQVTFILKGSVQFYAAVDWRP